jgi:sporulation protein YlmC with PRC-barrel domain
MALIPIERVIYLTELTGLKVIGPDGQRIGKVVEAAVKPTEHPRRVSIW